MRFVKMQGLGNDFVMVNGFENPLPADPAGLSRSICDRHFGVGADGLIWMLPSDCADAEMRVFNSDGSEAEMCGNGLRCAAQFLRDEGLCGRDTVRIDTLAGTLTVQLTEHGIIADMGEPCFDPARIPVAADSNAVSLSAGGRTLRFFCVSMGNPHAVTFDLFPDDGEFRLLGAALERHPAFPARANIEFCRLRDGGIDVRVWERGDGETLACGTGASAVLAAAASQGLSGRESVVRLPGGDLFIRWAEDNHLFMRGPARTVFVGDYPV